MQFQPIIEWFKSLVLLVWSFDGVKFIVIHILVNVVVAVAAGMKTKTFNLSKLGDFLIAKLLPYVTVYVVAKVFGEQIDMAWLAPAAWAIITATLLGDLGDSLTQLGLQLPQSIRSLIVKP